MIVFDRMKIIDNKKCYYDYLQGVLGMDEKVTYDRRGSTVVSVSEYQEYDFPKATDLWFSKNRFKDDIKRRKVSYWHSNSYKARNIWRKLSWRSKEFIEEGNIYYLFLEVGYHQFIFEVERYLDDNDKVVIEVNIVEHKFVDKEHKESDKPLFLSSMHFKYGTIRELDNFKVDNPILTNTWIPKYIPAQDMWNMLYEYISSLNDKEFTDTRTNEQHIESHGFDKKISFRKRK